ncbi:hypothetical protein NAV33_07435 [Pseudomonas stutzeri]|uniref:hypothetical protein n=1 Tax=Stutzerimonas stutzeri TaxID=316 RepID=UPI00210E5A19|nr:hypothetical protein [Stutzerimonas stutzeri]MCQ4311727.1 hypothetical protein [Stutzerimonas stutzeri]
MNRIELNIGGRDFVFAVEFIDDQDAGAPWDNSDCHGVVTGWERRDHYKGGKHPGELILAKSDRCNRDGRYRFYDFAASCRLALRDGWDAHPYNEGDETKRQQAAKAARSDFEYLRGWCNDEWRYVGVVVTLLDDGGEKTEVSDSLWCVETFGDYHEVQARTLADELLGGYGVSWDQVSKTSYGYTQMSVA